MNIVNRVSGYFRGRVFYKDMYASDSTWLVTDVRAMIAKGETITSATWQTWDNSCVRMVEAEIDGSTVKVKFATQYSGFGRIKVDVRTSEGQTITAWHVLRVKSAPYFNGQQWVTGPQRIDVTA